MKEITLTSANAHKAQELEEMFRPPGYTAKTLLGLKEDIEIEETGTIFEENALIKARAIHKRLEIEAVAGDSGLVASVLDGASGIYSARFIGRDISYDVKNQYPIDQCRHAEDKGYQFICVVIYVQADGSEHVFIEVVEGIMADNIEGAKGSGYDLTFYYPPYKTTLADVSEEQKDCVSHRGRVLTKLIALMEKEK